MATRPHDLTDLYLALVVLTVDTLIEELGRRRGSSGVLPMR
jgi:hypothetical protein